MDSYYLGLTSNRFSLNKISNRCGYSWGCRACGGSVLLQPTCGSVLERNAEPQIAPKHMLVLAHFISHLQWLGLLFVLHLTFSWKYRGRSTLCDMTRSQSKSHNSGQQSKGTFVTLANEGSRKEQFWQIEEETSGRASKSYCSQA